MFEVSIVVKDCEILEPLSGFENVCEKLGWCVCYRH